jgi:hypothetical protein
MYRVAVIQNESEMMRYGWADILPMVSGIEYEWASFTAENLSVLFTELPLHRYDAVLIATNACNDQNVTSILQESSNKEILKNFLDANGGIFISFQMRLTTTPRYNFVPDPFDVRAINRKEIGTDGAFKIPQTYTKHILYQYPHQITESEVLHRCLHNEFVKSLYRGYLVPVNDGVYDSLLVDDSYDESRTLMLCSRPDVPGRIVVTSIPLDWQGHQKLLENVVRYVVEGQPYLAVVQKQGKTFFDFQYLIASLEVLKVPFTKYAQSDLDFQKISLPIHNTIILDPSWSPDDLVTSNFAQFSDSFKSGARLIYLGQTKLGNPTVGYVGGLKNVQTMLSSTVTWVRSEYKNGKWGGSFWQTFDVIESFVDLGISVEEYRDEVLDGIEPNKIQGSYAEVMGATCAMLKLYNIFLGSDSAAFIESLHWISQKFPEASLYEQASAIDTLNEVNQPFDHDILETFRSVVTNPSTFVDDELRLYRYAKTLLSSGYTSDAVSFGLKLGKYQLASGAWLNVARTASFVLLLMQIQQKMTHANDLLDEMIFKGITFLKSAYDPANGNWHDDVPSTVKALRAVSDFEKRISYPIDEIVNALKRIEKGTQEFRAIEVAGSHVAQLQKERSDLKKQQERDYRLFRFAKALATWLAVFSVPSFILIVLLGLHIIWNGKVQVVIEYVKTFLRDWTFAVSTSLPLVPVIALYIILRALDRIPRLKIIPEEWEDAILERIVGK